MEFKIEEGKTKDDIKLIVDEKLNKLYGEAPERELIGFERLGSYKGIIREDTLIDNGDAYYYIKDRDYLYEFVYYIYKNNITNIDSILKLVYKYIRYYFGDSESEELRGQILNQDIENGYNDISILRNKNAAMCAEKAAMAQNIFSFFDIDSWYVVGDVYSNQGSGPHAFNIVNYKDNYYIYDSTRTVPVYVDNKIVDYQYYINQIELNTDNFEYTLADYYYEKHDNQFKRVRNGKVIYNTYNFMKNINERKI